LPEKKGGVGSYWRVGEGGTKVRAFLILRKGGRKDRTT